jgi:integrase
MARMIDPSRRCLPVEEWPAPDQLLWRTAMAPPDLEDDERGPATAWRAGTAQTNREGYGRWLNHLLRTEQAWHDAPADRVTPAHVRTFLAELREQGISIRTQCNRISQVLSVMLEFAPERDWGWLRRRFNRLDALAREDRRCKPPVLLAGDILDKAFKALGKLRQEGPPSSQALAIEYRNWLMLAGITLMPLRRQNFATLSIERHFRRAGNEWLIEIPAAEAKAGRPIVMPVPPVLLPHIEHYLDHVRPALLKGRSHDRLWITNRHGPMTGHSYYIAMTNFTREVLGTKMSPHRARHTGATSIIIAAPEKIEAARAFLGHSDDGTTEEHYIVAQSFTASRRQAALVAKLRRTLPGGHAERDR